MNADERIAELEAQLDEEKERLVFNVNLLRGRELQLGEAIEEARILREQQTTSDGITDAIIADRNRILDACLCPVHGQCVPYVLETLSRQSQTRQVPEHPFGFTCPCDACKAKCSEMAAKATAQATRACDCTFDSGGIIGTTWTCQHGTTFCGSISNGGESNG